MPFSCSHNPLGTLRVEKHTSQEGCVIPAATQADFKNSLGDFALLSKLPKCLYIKWPSLFLSVSLMPLKAILIFNMLIHLETGAYKRWKAFSCESTLSSTHRGRVFMKSSISWVCKGHKFSLSCTVSSKRLKWAESRRKELQERQLISEATNTTGREAGAMIVHGLPNKIAFYSNRRKFSPYS